MGGVDNKVSNLSSVIMVHTIGLRMRLNVMGQF